MSSRALVVWSSRALALVIALLALGCDREGDGASSERPQADTGLRGPAARREQARRAEEDARAHAEGRAVSGTKNHGGQRPGDSDSSAVPLAAAQARTADAQPPAGGPRSFADLARQSDPAVVFVRTLTAERRGFRRQLREGAGSGFVFDPAGKILTNYHVVKGASAIQVEMSDGRVLSAQVVGADPHTDVAVLAVEAKMLPALPLGDSDRVRVGDWVMAIGNPFGLEHTVSAGIISARERTTQDVQLGNPAAYYSFLQTDASINPGNSGGPLIDMAGHVVGMNTAVNASANNIGFAIPANMLRELLPRLLRDGVVQRAAIGVQVWHVSHQEMAQLGLPDRNGALVVSVLPRSPAMRAKLEPGDVIIRLGGREVRTPEQLRWRASLLSIGEPAEVVVRRGGKELTLSVRPAPMR